MSVIYNPYYEITTSMLTKCNICGITTQTPNSKRYSITRARNVVNILKRNLEDYTPTTPYDWVETVTNFHICPNCKKESNDA